MGYLRLVEHVLIENKYYLLEGKHLCVFKKVTPKGSNFISLRSGKKVFKKNLYPKRNDVKRTTYIFLDLNIVEFKGISENEVQNIGRYVVKCSISSKEPNGKKFKSKEQINRVKGIILHPELKIPAYIFDDDNSYVECRRCLVVNKYTDEQIKILNYIQKLSKKRMVEIMKGIGKGKF